MATTAYVADHLGRWLQNDNPGTSTALDSLGRGTIASDKDCLGRSLTKQTVAFPATTAVTLGQYIRVGTAPAVIYRVTVAGTTAAGNPTAPAVGATVVSGTATLLREK